MSSVTEPGQGEPEAGAIAGTEADDAAPSKATEPRPDKEAARYRRQLREAQAANEALTERVAGMQRREVERLAADRLAMPGDLFDLGGVEMAQLLTDDGNVDAAKVAAALDELVKSRPGLQPAPTPPDFDGGSMQPPPASGPNWSDVLNPRRRPR